MLEVLTTWPQHVSHLQKLLEYIPQRSSKTFCFQWLVGFHVKRDTFWIPKRNKPWQSQQTQLHGAATRSHCHHVQHISMPSPSKAMARVGNGCDTAAGGTYMTSYNKNKGILVVQYILGHAGFVSSTALVDSDLERPV